MPQAPKKKFDFGKLFGNATPAERRRMQTQMNKWGGGNMDNLRGRTPTAGIAGDTTKAVQPLGSPTSTKGAIRRVSKGRQPVRSSDTTKEGKKKMTRHHQATFNFEDRLIEAIMSNPNAFAMLTEGRREGWTRGADKWKKRGLTAAAAAALFAGTYHGTQAIVGKGKKKEPQKIERTTPAEERPSAPTMHQGRGVSADEDEIGDSKNDPTPQSQNKNQEGESQSQNKNKKSLGKGRVTKDNAL